MPARPMITLLAMKRCFHPRRAHGAVARGAVAREAEEGEPRAGAV